MDFSMIYSLVWKIVFAILKKEGLFDENTTIDILGTTDTATTTTTQSTDSTSTGTGTPGSVLDSIIGRIGLK